MESFDYLEEIRRSNSYDIALLTTFNFEIDFFEHFILNALNNNGVRKVSVFADGKQFAEALKNVTDSSLGRRYTVNPITISGAFHPKLLLMLNPQRAKLFVSSCNLTMSGFCMNNEIVNVFSYDAEHPENLKLITHAIGFFEKLAALSEKTLSYECEKELFEEIRKLPYYGKNNVNNALYLLDNLDNSILQQVRELMPSVESVDIAVPYYDNGLVAVEEIHKSFPSASIRLFLQNGKSQFPPERVEDEGFEIFQYLNLSLELEKEVHRESDHFYHGKVFRFLTEHASYILYGSANCTGSALCRSFSSGGNIECDVLEIGERNEFDPFFAGFKEDDSVFSCEGLKSEPAAGTNFYFQCGVLEQSMVQLCFGCSVKPASLRIVIEGNEYPYSWSEDEVRISIPSDQLVISSDIFDTIFVTADYEESVRCWILFKDVLTLFRIADATGGAFSFHIDSSGDQYIQERLSLLQALALSPEDIERIQEAQRLVEQPETEVDTELGEDDNGIIDYVPPPAAALELYQTYTKVFDIERSYSISFRDWIKLADEHTGISNKGLPANETQITEKYQIRDEDKAFGRFVKSCCKKMLNERFVELVDPADYYKRIHIFFEILDRFTILMMKNGEDEPGEMLFSAVYVADIKTKMLLNLAVKYQTDYQDDEIITLVFLTIMTNHILSREGNDVKKVNEYNRKLLKTIFCDDSFRELGYLKYVSRAASMLELKEVPVDFYSEIQYVNGLFGYKSMKTVKESLLSDYGKNAVITVKDGTLHIKTSVEALGDYMKMREGSFRDINGYVKNMGNIEKIIVEINTTKARKGKNPATQIKYVASNLPTNAVKQIIARSNGIREEKILKVF